MITPEMWAGLRQDNERLRAALVEHKIRIDQLEHALRVVTVERDAMADLLTALNAKMDGLS